MTSETGRSNKRRGASRAAFALICIALTASLAFTVRVAQASDYQPPTGFNGHTWNTPLSSFRGLSLLTANTALGSRGKLVSLSNTGRICDGGRPCLTPGAFLMQTEQIDGVGSYALGEYYFDSEPNPWPGAKIDLYTISYLFCASSHGYLPKHIKDALNLCGARVMFHSEDLEARATLPSGYVTNERRILQQLINQYGEPPNFKRHGRILIDPNGDEVWPTESDAPVEYVLYRWCGLGTSSRSLHPPCPSTVTFVFNETRGIGMVLFATNAVYDYAYARHVTGDENNDIYVILNSPRLDLPYTKVVPQDTNRIHTQRMVAMSAQEYREFQP